MPSAIYYPIDSDVPAMKFVFHRFNVQPRPPLNKYFKHFAEEFDFGR